MCTIIKQFANTGLANIAAANTALDGSGIMNAVLTSPGGRNGTTVNSVTVKAIGNTTQGMVRLFINTAGAKKLIKEISIPGNTVSSTVPPFQVTMNEPITLNPNDILMASTQIAQPFNIFADGTDWLNCECTDVDTCNTETVVYNSGMAAIASASPTTVLTAIPVAALANGTSIPIIDIKGATLGSVQQCIVSLYINDGITDWLVWDVPIPAFTQSNVQPTYRTKCIAGINLQPGYLLRASVNGAATFNVIALGSDITNCDCAV